MYSFRAKSAIIERHFFQTSHLEYLPRPDRLDELCSLDQALEDASVEPRKPALESFDLHLPQQKARLVDARGLQLPALRWYHCIGQINDVVTIEITPHDRVIRARACRPFLDGARTRPPSAELDDTEALGLLDLVPENRRTVFLSRGL